MTMALVFVGLLFLRVLLLLLDAVHVVAVATATHDHSTIVNGSLLRVVDESSAVVWLGDTMTQCSEMQWTCLADELRPHVGEDLLDLGSQD